MAIRMDARTRLPSRQASPATRRVTIDPQTRLLKGNMFKYAGLGAAPTGEQIRAKDKDLRKGLGSMIDLINSSQNMPVWNMDVIEQVRWGMQGPQTDASIQQNFGAKIDLFGGGTNVAGIDYVETTMAQPGQTQTYFIACHVGFQIEAAPMCWTARGNAWTVPEVGTAAPPSPDVFTANDIVNGALGAAIAAGTQTMVPANFEFGWWGNFAAWHMVRGYNLRWKIGQHINIMDDVLRHTAYMPTNAQEGSASSSEVDIINFILDANERYNRLGSGLNFLPIDFVRVGSVTLAGEVPPNVGVFSPSRDFDLVPATYGGMDFRSLLRNTSEFRRLNLPYVIKPGIPIGLYCQENDTDQASAMREFLSITNNRAEQSIPPITTPAPNVNASFTSTGANVMLERVIDPAGNTPQQVPVERATFKAGPLKLTLAIKGFEVGEDWYNTMQTNTDIRDLLMAETGVRF